MLSLSHRATICQLVAEVQLNVVAPLGAASHQLAKHIFLLSMESLDAAKKKLQCGGLLANGHMPRVSRQSLSANGKGDNEMILGAAHRYPGIYLKAEGTLYCFIQ